MEEKVTLEQLGLTKIEAEVYLALLKLGSTTTGPLVRKTKLHRATVYDVLKRLIEKGLIAYITKEKTKHFVAVKPEHFLDIVEEEKEQLKIKEKKTKYLIYQLKKITKDSKQKQTAQIFIGIKGAKTVLEETIKHQEILILGPFGKFKERLGPYFYQLLRKKRELKIITKLIDSKSTKGANWQKLIYGEKRFISEQYQNPISTMIFGNNIANFIWTENPMIILIESKEAVDSYRKYFENIWEIAEK